jgi:ubiquinone/menaquinone biosynthesis C-methylase UbiE
MKNKDLKKTYNQMHTEGKQAWFDDGQAEREAILEMGEPWTGKTVLEIGCGEGDLMNMIWKEGGLLDGCDYSAEAIKIFDHRYPILSTQAVCNHWRDLNGYPEDGYNFLVMQGVMEHLDDPFTELAEMIERFKPKTVITSMPSFLNLRGIIWHSLNMVGAVMSKTDLHFIDPWEVEGFCDAWGYGIFYETIDLDWGNGKKMLEDLHKRIPLALKDGAVPIYMPDVNKFLEWLERAFEYFDHDEGAVNIYRIDI